MMALWPFAKHDNDEPGTSDGTDDIEGIEGSDSTAATDKADLFVVPDGISISSGGGSAVSARVSPSTDAVDAARSARCVPEHPGAGTAFAVEHDPVNGQFGPFDADMVNVEDFDFSDFAVGILDLGSMKIALPKNSGVTVDSDENGSQQLRIMTEYGSIIPVAFASSRSAQMWVKNAEESLLGIASDGFPARFERGPWGTEVVSQRPEGAIRIIGIEGPRWMLRLTLAAPAGKEEQMAQLGREIAARTFVCRGAHPVLTGTSLPVILPEQLVSLLEKRIRQMQEDRKQQKIAAEQAVPKTAAEAEAIAQMRKLHGWKSGDAYTDIPDPTDALKEK